MPLRFSHPSPSYKFDKEFKQILRKLQKYLSHQHTLENKNFKAYVLLNMENFKVVLEVNLK